MAEQKKHVPFVSSETNMAEFTVRALIIGLVLAIVLGAANAYLGLKAGMTIAATYPAAVIGMALLKAMKGTILEENFTRTVGSIGESIAAGAIFTIPAFYISGVWAKFDTLENYLVASAIMFSGGVLGIMFVALLRRVMVEDAELPFPESVAASEIHKAGRSGGTGAKFLFTAMGIGAVIQTLGQLNFFATSWEKFISFAKSTINLKAAGSVTAQGGMVLSSPGVSPAYIGVGYIIGPKLASLNFSGGLLAWGLFVPMILYFLSPQLISQFQQIHPGQNPANEDWITWSTMVWRFIVRPIAIGGMLVSSGFTLYRMRKSLATGIKRSISDVKKAASGEHVVERVDQDLNFKWVMFGIGFAAILTFCIYYYFAQNVFAALVATVVMIIAGFFFAAVSGYLVGIIGSSNNPISGLTLSTLIIAALLMVALGMSGKQGVAAVLGVAAVVCVSSAVAGEMLQDLKVGHILGGTPKRMQIGDLFGVAIAAAVMFLPLLILHQGDINAGKMAIPQYEGGFGSAKLAAPQAGLMALLSQGIVKGEMAWPLIIVGMLMGFGFILMQVKSPMLVAVGMYLPLETTFAIFIGGIIKGIVEKMSAKKNHNDAQKARVENNGVLLAAGLIAGEALVGLVFAAFAFFEIPLFTIFSNPSFLISLVVFAFIGWYLIKIPLENAGTPDQPAPPTVSM
jgi:putative OPT family oligopeptide transporter